MISTFRELLLLFVIGASVQAHADVMPLPLDYKPPPPRQSLAVELRSRIGDADWTTRNLLLPAERSITSPQILLVKTAIEPGGCFNLILHFFGDGTVRPTGQMLDELCQLERGDWQELKGDGSVAQFSAHKGQDVLEVQVSARWVNLNGPGLSALTRAELQSELGLSPEQSLLQTSQRQWMAKGVQQEAVDRAWRAARRPR